MSGYVLTVRSRISGRWYLGLVGGVMILHGGGILFGWIPTRRFLELIYPGRDAPVVEARDMGWAWAFLIVGGLLVVWTVGRLVVRRPVIRSDPESLLLSVGGPFRRTVTVPWDTVQEVSTGVASDDYGSFPTLVVRMDDPGMFDFQPWGATWAGEGVLSIDAEKWVPGCDEVAEGLIHLKTAVSEPLAEDDDLDSHTQEMEAEQARVEVDIVGEGSA